jgi:putative Holliday junction resolvase
MAVDPGRRRVGVAISDPTGTIAQPLTVLPAQPEATLVARLVALAHELEVTCMVVGLPRRMDGSLGPEAQAAMGLAEGLRRASGLPTELVDERLTSVAAERALVAADVRRARRRRLADQVAAAFILQAYLDRSQRGVGGA